MQSHSCRRALDPLLLQMLYSGDDNDKMLRAKRAQAKKSPFWMRSVRRKPDATANSSLPWPTAPLLKRIKHHFKAVPARSSGHVSHGSVPRRPPGLITVVNPPPPKVWLALEETWLTREREVLAGQEGTAAAAVLIDTKACEDTGWKWHSGSIKEKKFPRLAEEGIHPGKLTLDKLGELSVLSNW